MARFIHGLTLSLFMMTQIFIIQGSAASSSAASSSATKEKPLSWFREKYIRQTYDDYYEYTVKRYSLEDNDRDICPDFHKSATIFAITGQQIYRIIRTCSVYIYPTTTTTNDNIHYTPHESHFKQISQITVMDVIQLIRGFLCYTFEIGMYAMSILLLCCSTILITIVMYCHY